MFAKPARSIVATLLLSALVAVPAAAGMDEPEAVPVAAEADDGIVDLEAMVVSGAQPGPGMWKVSSGDNVLYILGTVSPLPRRMEWMSDDVEAVIADARVVISSPAVVVDADIGIFRGMALLPSMLRARNNPGKRPLREMVSPELYARWEVLKARYMGRDRGVEKRRPLLAAQELYEAALRKSGLRMGGVVGPVVAKARKAAGVPLVDTTVRLKLEDPKGVLKELNESDLADRECFAGTLDRIETDLDNMRARANAWAVGDIEGLRALPWENHYATCQDAVTGSALAQRLGIDDLPRRAKEAWLSNVEEALAEHPASFALLPMHHLLGDDGMLATLAARGYAIESP
ncbi:TraB/GumN family protein [Luteimonas sp. A534]